MPDISRRATTDFEQPDRTAPRDDLVQGFADKRLGKPRGAGHQWAVLIGQRKAIALAQALQRLRDEEMMNRHDFLYERGRGIVGRVAEVAGKLSTQRVALGARPQF